MTSAKLFSRIRAMIALFVTLLILSGVTAFPVYTELKWIMEHHPFSAGSWLENWLGSVFEGVSYVNDKYPFLFYGFDWLAFAHIVIGLAFIGPYREPVRNKWVIDWAMIACLGVLPLAFIAGPIRGIPMFHILIDCSFGIIGIIPLLIVRRWIKQLEKMQAA